MIVIQRTHIICLSALHYSIDIRYAGYTIIHFVSQHFALMLPIKAISSKYVAILHIFVQAKIVLAFQAPQLECSQDAPKIRLHVHSRSTRTYTFSSTLALFVKANLYTVKNVILHTVPNHLHVIMHVKVFMHLTSMSEKNE